jgi:hypothetical protein
MLDRALPVAALVLLAVGFGDMALGGTTLSAASLVLAYAVVVPAAIVRGRLPGRQRGRVRLLPR